MTVRDFPLCCAGYILCEFGNTRTAIDGTPYSPEAIEEFLERKIRAYTNYMGFAMIAINQDQEVIMRKLLRKLKFRRVAKDIFHPGHSSRIFIYIRELSKDHYLNPNRPKK